METFRIMKPYEKPELDAILVDGTDIVCDSNMGGGGDAGGDNGDGGIDFGGGDAGSDNGGGMDFGTANLN